MGVRAATGLHVGDLFRMIDVGDIPDAYAIHPVLAGTGGHTLGATIDAVTTAFGGDEQEVAIDRRITLPRRAEHGLPQHRLPRIGDVPDREPTEVPLKDIVAAERQVGVRV